MFFVGACTQVGGDSRLREWHVLPLCTGLWYESIKLGYKMKKWQFFAEIFVLLKNLSYLCTEFIKPCVMKELKKEFIGIGVMRGFEFKQLANSVCLVGDKRVGRYLYSVTSPTGVAHYEVFDHVEYARFDVVSYPGAQSFGSWAKCCASYDRAMRYFRDGFE